MKLVGPLKFHGGKRYLAERFVEIFKRAPHCHYVEACAGGLSVLLAKDPHGVSEVVNDADGRVSQFWSVLQDQAEFAKFQRLAQATPFSQVEWEQAAYGMECHGQLAPHEAAWCFFVYCRQSLAGRMGGFAPLSRLRTRRGMNEQAAAWINAVWGLEEVHKRLMRVAVLKQDVVKVLHSQDGESTLFYIDPPYLIEDGGERTTPDVYEHEMGLKKHKKLLGTLANLKGYWALSGYHSTLYDNFFKRVRHTLHEFDIANHASGEGGKRRMTECLWTNF